MLKKWLLLMGLSVLAGGLTGGCICWNSPECRLYAACHFYRLLSRIVVRTVDKYTLISAGVLALLLLVTFVANRCAGKIRAILRIVLPLLVVGAVVAYFLPRSIWSRLILLFGNPEFRFWGVQALLLLLLVAAGLFLWKRRKPRTMAHPAPAPKPPRPSSRRTAWPLLQGISAALLACWLVLQAAGGLFWTISAVAVRRQPNIVLVMICSLRADHLGCYGYDLNTTPNLDQFARQSTRFKEAIAPSSWTLWSTAAVFTSRYPEFIFRNNDYQASNACYPGLPPMLSNLGYATSAVTDHPFFADDLCYNYHQGFDTYDYFDCGVMLDHKRGPEITDRALQRIAQHQQQKFFLYTMYAEPHEPYSQHQQFVFGPSRKDDPGPHWAASQAYSLTPQQMAIRQTYIAKYNSEIAFADNAIGKLFAGLKQMGLYDDALIIVCGDHGEEFLEHGGTGHQLTLYHEVISVPLLIKFPRQTQGKVIDGRFPLIDLYPSIMTMLHQPYASLGTQGEGVDLSALLRCTQKPIFDATVSSAKSVLTGHYQYCLSRHYDWQGVQFPFTSWSANLSEPLIEQLFDLRSDPGEYRNILAGQSDVTSTLREVLHGHDTMLSNLVDLLKVPSSISQSDYDKALQRMKALGYAQE